MFLGVNKLVPLSSYENVALFIAHPAEADAFLAAGLPIHLTNYGTENATAYMERYLSRSRPDLILVLGTAGRLNKKLNPYHVYDINMAGFKNAGETPERLIYNQTEEFRPQATILTTSSFVTSAPEGLNFEPDLVDMETYNYFQVAKSHSIAIRVFKAVSDDADMEAEIKWDKEIPNLSNKLYHFYKTLGIMNLI